MPAGLPDRSLRLVPETSVVVFLDMQERLMPAIHDDAAVRQRARLLAFGAQQSGVPMVGTEMNPTRLGPLVDAFGEHCAQVMPKMTFGAADAGLTGMIGAVAPQATQVVLAGTEAHVAVSQTALGLMELGHPVWVVSDACGSRDPRDYQSAMARLTQQGATVLTVESVIFEWMHSCEHPGFRSMSRQIKEPRFPSPEA